MREDPEIVEVFHPAVVQTQVHHRLILFRDHGLSRIDAQPRRRQIQDGRILGDFRLWRDRVPEADVDLKADSGPVGQADGQGLRAPQPDYLSEALRVPPFSTAPRRTFQSPFTSASINFVCCFAYMR